MARFKRASEDGGTSKKASSSSSKARYVLDEAERPSKKTPRSKPSKHPHYEDFDEEEEEVSSREDAVREYEGRRGKQRQQAAKRQRRQARYDEESDDGVSSDYDSAGDDDDSSDSDASSGRNADNTLVEDDTPPPKRRRGRPPKAVEQELAEKRMRPLEVEYNIHEEDEEEEFDDGDDHDDEDDVSLDSADDVEAPSGTHRGGQEGRGRRKGNANHLKRWRHMAEEERQMLVTRGGLIWQAARPLLAAMSEEDRTEAADVLKGLMRGLDAKLAATLIPGTFPMPRHNQDNPNSTAAMTNSYAIQSSLMSWSVENQGMLKQIDDDEDEADATLRRLSDGDVGNVSQLTDPDRTLTNDQAPPKGFRADILVLESMLVPEASEILALLRSLEEQDINLERAKRRLQAMKQNAERTDSRAIEAHEKILKAVSRSITQVHDSGERHPMGKAYEAALSEAARQSLAS